MSFTSFPRWLESSGLPEVLNTQVPPYGYFVFKKLVEIDLFQNVTPDIISTSLCRLQELTGISDKIIQEHLAKMEDLHYLRIFWGSIPREELFLCVNIPVKTPQSPLEISVDKGGYKGRPEEHIPYFHKPAFDRDEDDLDQDEYFQTKLEHVTNWFIQTIKPDLNPIILQKIRYLCQTFSYQDLQQAFRNAKKNKVRSLECLMRELYSFKKH